MAHTPSLRLIVRLSIILFVIIANQVAVAAARTSATMCQPIAVLPPFSTFTSQAPTATSKCSSEIELTATPEFQPTIEFSRAAM
jgi:hypothetical protein